MQKPPKITPVTIGPDTVDEHIDRCKSNRARTRKHVNTWVRAIKKGHFRDGGLIFADERGMYDDAQHRLWAIKMTGHKALFYLISGLDRATLNMTVDAGKKRTNADRLSAKNIRYASLICSSIEEIIDLIEPWRKTALMLLPDEVFNYYDDNARELDTLAQAYAKYPDIPPKFLITFQHLFTKIDAAKADQFFASLTHRPLLKKGEPLYAFYEMLGSEKVVNTENVGRVHRYIRNGLILAWNAHLKGETIDHMEPTERYITLEGTAIISHPEESAEVNGGGIDEEDEPETVDAEV